MSLVRPGEQITLGNVIGLLMGFTLGVLFRSSAVAVVAYFVYGFVMPPLTELLSATQEWFRDVRGWVDPNFAQGQLLNDTALSSTQWAHLGVTSLVWLVVPPRRRPRHGPPLRGRSSRATGRCRVPSDGKDPLMNTTLVRPPNRMIAGVCSRPSPPASAWKPGMVRLLFVLSCLLPGPQFIAYLVLVDRHARRPPHDVLTGAARRRASNKTGTSRAMHRSGKRR